MTDHTEMQIPDDVMEAARKSLTIGGAPYGSPKFMKRLEASVARAILAERERCAKIAQGYDHGFYAAEAILGRKLE